MLNEEEYDYNTYINSFGILLYVLFTCKVQKQSMKIKMREKKIPIPETSSKISEFCIKLIQKCLSNDPEDSPSFEEILHQLTNQSFTNVTWSSIFSKLKIKLT